MSYSHEKGLFLWKLSMNSMRIIPFFPIFLVVATFDLH